MGNINCRKNPHKSTEGLPYSYYSITNKDKLEKALRFHQSIPGYTPTPLYSMQKLASYLNVQEIMVKDESRRFSLNSFKALGSSYAIAQYLANECGENLSFFTTLQERLKSLPKRTFATATDGNHGKGLAWAAKIMGQQSVVYMPKGSSEYRLEAVRELGARAYITEYDYDETVRYVADLAGKHDWVLVQDTSWKGYTEIPTLIMQGYLTILNEIKEEITPTHVILQAGVGSFAAAIAGGLQHIINSPLKIIIVEPTKADCFYRSANSQDGSPQSARGDLSSIMAGLSCGNPSYIAWDILKNTADYFISCDDPVAARGMRILGNPLEGDPAITSGESGAVPMGVLYEICSNPELSSIKKQLDLNPASRVLFINTEGATEPENYRRICWDGMYQNSEITTFTKHKIYTKPQ